MSDNHQKPTTTIKTPYIGRVQLLKLLGKTGQAEPLTFNAVAYRYGAALEVSLYHKGEWVDTYANTAAAALHELAQLVRGLRREGIPARVTLRIHPASRRFQGEGVDLPF